MGKARNDSLIADLFSGAGVEVNPAKIGGVTELLGDPTVKLEKPHTIIRFPGGHIEIARTSDDRYWVHLAVMTEVGARKGGRIIDARLNFAGRYGDASAALLREEIEAGDLNHIAFLVLPGERGSL